MDPTLIADLIHAGVAPELVARVANAMVEIACSRGNSGGNSGGIPVETPVDFAAEKRRAWDRARKRNPVETPRNPVENAEIPPELQKTPLTISKKDNSKKESKKERACRIPPEWQPSQIDSDFAFSKGMSHERTATETEKFRNYWTAKSGAGATKLDWAATWKNWVLQSIERVPGNQPPVPIDKEPDWKKPPWEREGITQAVWRERELGKINGTQIRRDAGMGKNGADRSSELPLSGGGALRESRVQTRDASDDFP
jgi:hypothetical protein